MRLVFALPFFSLHEKEGAFNFLQAPQSKAKNAGHQNKF
jgi:hypothetical protein